jgi:hypothetical protein
MSWRRTAMRRSASTTKLAPRPLGPAALRPPQSHRRDTEHGSMSSVLINIVVGLVTSLLSGTAVWVGQRLLSLRRRQQAAAFFGVRAGERCLLVIYRTPWQPSPDSMRHVQALVDLAVRLRELGAPVGGRRPWPAAWVLGDVGGSDRRGQQQPTAIGVWTLACHDRRGFTPTWSPTLGAHAGRVHARP